MDTSTKVSNKGNKIKVELGPIEEHSKQDNANIKMREEPMELEEKGNRNRVLNWRNDNKSAMPRDSNK